MSKSVKDQTTKAFQVGGYNPPSVPQQPYTQPTQVDPQTGTYTLPGTGIAGYQVPSGTPTGYTPYGGATPYFQPVQFTGPQYQTSLQTTNLPTFAETVGRKPGQYDELRTYINDAGQTLQIPFKDGKPIYPIPEGYRPIGDEPAPEEEQTTVTPTLGQTTVRDEGGGRDNDVTVTPTTEAAKNVYKGYSKGYAGLSTAFGSGTGGLSAAATKAKKDFGITGQQTGNLGSLASFVMAASGVPIGLSMLTAGKGGYLTDTPVTPGAIGTVSYDDLVAIANGTVPTRTEDLVNQQTAKNVIAAQKNYAVNLSGKIGYNTGDINPVTGTPVRNGMAVNSAFGPGPTTASYATVAHMKDTIARGTKAGWRGGYVSKDVYDNLSDAAKENYDKFDAAHSFTDMGFDINDIDLDDFDAREAAEKGFGVEDIEDMEVTSGRPSAVFDDPSDFDDDDSGTGFSGTSDKSAADFGKADVATGNDGGGRSEDRDADPSGKGSVDSGGPGASPDRGARGEGQAAPARAKGGLIEKQMKQSGLASKK